MKVSHSSLSQVSFHARTFPLFMKRYDEILFFRFINIKFQFIVMKLIFSITFMMTGTSNSFLY